MHASSQISTTIVVLVAALAILIPVVTRVVSSPLLVLLISPFLLLLFAAVFAISYVFLGHLLDSKRPRQRNVLQSAARPFVFSTPAAWQAAMTRSKWSHKVPESLPPLYPENLAVSSALNDIITMILRDFVMGWYSELSTSPSFPTAMSTLIRASLERLIQRASTIDIPVLVVKRILPKVTAHIDQFRQSEIALRGAGLERRLTQSEELDLLLASRYSSKGGEKLHPAIDNLSTTFTKQTEEIHLKLLVEKALPFVLPEAESKSQVLNIAAREIVACAILYPVMDMLADPDFWNQVIDHFVGIFQNDFVHALRHAF
jgi:sorting nexin-25